jgi:hypothetical protein
MLAVTHFLSISLQKRSSETRHNSDLLHLTGLKYYHGINSTPLPFRVGNIDRYPTYKGGKVTEVVVYANYIGLRRFYRYVVNIGRWSPYEGGQLDRFHCIWFWVNVLYESKFRFNLVTMMIFGILTKWHCNKNCICCKYVGLYINICYFTRVIATMGASLPCG